MAEKLRTLSPRSVAYHRKILRQALLGHSSVGVTLDIYSHAVPALA